MESDEATERAVRVIQLVKEILPDEVRKEARGRASTLGARATLEVLRHYKLKVRAVPVTVQAFNTPFGKRLRKGGKPPQDSAQLGKWRKEDGSSAIGLWKAIPQVVVIVAPNADEEYDGVLVDTSLGQVSAPQQGVALEEACVTSIPQGFLAGTQVQIAKVGECYVRYQRITTDEWTKSEGWRNEDLRKFVIERAIAKIDLKLLGSQVW